MASLSIIYAPTTPGYYTLYLEVMDPAAASTREIGMIQLESHKK